MALFSFIPFLGHPNQDVRHTRVAGLLLIFAVALLCFSVLRRELGAQYWQHASPRGHTSSDDLLFPLPPPTPDELLADALRRLGAVYSRRGKVLRVSGLAFTRGRSSVTLSDAGQLDTVASLLKRYPDVQLVIEGYTDSRGSRLRNVYLSLERADSVRDMLVERGVGKARLLVRGMGPVDPISSNSTADGRAENRRIEIVFTDTEGRFAFYANRDSNASD